MCDEHFEAKQEGVAVEGLMDVGSNPAMLCKWNCLVYCCCEKKKNLTHINAVHYFDQIKDVFPEMSLKALNCFIFFFYKGESGYIWE